LKANLEQLSEVFGISRRTISDWTKRGCPGTRAERSWTFDTAEVFAWRRERDLAEVRKTDPDHKLRRRKLAAATELAELSAAEKRGELVNRETAEMEIKNQVLAARGAFISLPGYAAPRVTRMNDGEAERFLKIEIYRILTELADGADKLGPKKGK
jgi:terminase small subunit / prophage DNA-packing protein